MSFTVFFFPLSLLQLLLLDLFEHHLLCIKLGVGVHCGKRTFGRSVGREKMQALEHFCGHQRPSTFLSQQQAHVGIELGVLPLV